MSLPSRARVVIMGGGIMGLGLAYNLCRRGITDVVLLERATSTPAPPAGTAAGCAPSGPTPRMIRLAKRSLEIGDGFASEMGINAWFRRGGYPLPGAHPEQADRIEKRGASPASTAFPRGS